MLESSTKMYIWPSYIEMHLLGRGSVTRRFWNPGIYKNANIFGGLDKMLKCTITAGPRHIYPFQVTMGGRGAVFTLLKVLASMCPFEFGVCPVT